MPMKNSGRSYLCADCRHPVLICSRCDHGHRYCAKNCARRRRRLSLRKAGRDYQNSSKGRHAHAARQRRYRARKTAAQAIEQAAQEVAQQEKVTHQGSPPPASSALLPSIPTDSQKPSPKRLSCHFCGCELDKFIRIDLLRCRIRRPSNRSNRRPAAHDSSP